MKTQISRGFAASALALSLAGDVFATGLTNVFSFPEETKVKGSFLEWNGQLYFTCEKGGANLFGYIGQYDRQAGTVTPIYSFPGEIKPKGGLTLDGDTFLLIGDKGGSANFGSIARFDPASSTWTPLYDFATDLKPKTALQVLDGAGFYFTTDRGGIQNAGMVARFEVGSGITTVASFTTNAGLKADAPFVKLNSQWYYAAREGGDLTQASGKGAGAIGLFDPAAGTVTKLVTLNAATHGAKIKSMIPVGTNWLYFTAEEGGDLSLNSGKGLGTICRLDVNTLTVERLCVFDGPVRGSKPKNLLSAGDVIYFVTGEGGPNNYGVFGAITQGTNVAILGAADAVLGAKSEGSLTKVGSELLFTTELGAASYFGSIVAYPLPAPPEPARLQYTLADGRLHIAWPTAYADCVLEQAESLDSATWERVSTPGSTSASVPADANVRFFRLRR